MPKWKAKPPSPQSTMSRSEVGARMNDVSNSTEPDASAVASHGRVSSCCCSLRTTALSVGRDHMPSKTYACSVGPQPQKRWKRAPHSSLHMPEAK